MSSFSKLVNSFFDASFHRIGGGNGNEIIIVSNSEVFALSLREHELVEVDRSDSSVSFKETFIPNGLVEENLVVDRTSESTTNA